MNATDDKITRDAAQTLLESLEAHCVEWGEEATHVFDSQVYDDIGITHKIIVYPLRQTHPDDDKFDYWRTDSWGNTMRITWDEAMDYAMHWMERLDA